MTTGSCCNQHRDAFFCPNCGRKLREPPAISGLLCYLSRTISKRKFAVVTMREQLATPGREPPFKIKKRIAVYEAEIHKFQRWKKAIQELREIAEASVGRGG